MMLLILNSAWAVSAALKVDSPVHVPFRIMF
jgi:hypothetical protein